MSHRKRILTLACLLAILALLINAGGPATTQTSFGQEETSPTAVWYPGRVLVKYKEEYINSEHAFANLARFEAQRVDSITALDLDILRVPEGEELAVIAALNEDPTVEYAEPDYQVKAFAIPNDPSFGNQWAHNSNRMDTINAWDIVTGTSDVTIAIIDSGIDSGHPDLAGKITAGWDWVGNDSNPADENGHGTHVAGIAAAYGNNGTGVAGVSWGAKIMPLRTLDDEGTGWSSDSTAAILWAVNNGADIINMSLGSSNYSQSAENAVNTAYNAGIPVIAAMGNNNTDTTFYPAGYDHVIAVSATNRNDQKATYSNYGAHVDVAAPGGYMTWYQDSNGIYSTTPTYDVYNNTESSYLKNYDFMHGTSQASPQVAGIVALMLSLNPYLTVDEIETTLETTADDLGTPGFDNTFGHGRVNAYGAVLGTSTSPDIPVLDPISNGDQNNEYWVDWDDIADADGYILQESATLDFNSVQHTYTISDSEKLITGTYPDIWFYRAKAVNSLGESDWSNIESVGVAPGQPTMKPLISTATANDYVLSWIAEPGALSYKLIEGTDITFATNTTRYLGTSTMYTITGQTQGDWYYKVYAMNQVGMGPGSNVVTTTIIMAPLQSPALNNIVNPESDGIYTLTWTMVPSATMYVLEQSNSTYFDDPDTVFTGFGTQYQVTGQVTGIWYYRVRAYNSAEYSSWSELRNTAVTGDIFFPFSIRAFEPSSSSMKHRIF